MRKEKLENVTLKEVVEFESQLLDVMKAAYEGDEKSIKIILKMKQVISSC